MDKAVRRIALYSGNVTTRANIIRRKKVGLSHTTLHRIEKGEHRLTLDKLQTVLEKLKMKLSDVFPEEY
jgi:hypothetical protein